MARFRCTPLRLVVVLLIASSASLIAQTQGAPHVGILVRLRRPWVLQADARLAHPLGGGCFLVGRSVDTSFEARTSRDPFSTSAIRVGVETPMSMPLVRLTAGIGALWGGPTLPYAVLGVAFATRGPRKRFLIEAERLQTRVHAEEVHHGVSGGTLLSWPIRVSPSTYTVRLGMEWALAGR
jgi:hypothetical protein